jgi:glycine/D-amino acid oxidase-like deaminating enzyme
MPEVLVAGAGIFGVTTALELADRGHRVTLLDRGPTPHPEASSTDVSKIVRLDYGSDLFYHRLAERSLDGWERWEAESHLNAYRPGGFLVLSSEPMRPGGFEYESRRVLQGHGYEPETLDAEALSRRYPAWNPSRYREAYLSPRGGWVDSAAVVRHLFRQCVTRGVQFARVGCSRLLMEGSRVVGLRTELPDRDLRADVVVVCLGAWTPTLVPWLSDVLRPVAQPVVHVRPENPAAFRGDGFPPFAADISTRGWYGFPALPDGRLKIGHHGPGHVVDPRRRGEVGEEHLRRVRDFLSESIPALANAPFVETRVCLYCDSVDGDFFIGPDPDHPGLVVAGGGSGHAFKFAPMLGGLVADAVQGRDNPWLERFAWRTGGHRRVEQARSSTAEGARS